MGLGYGKVCWRVLATVALTGFAAVAAAQLPAADDWVHAVEPGDTLLGLKARWLRPEARWQTLQRINRIADPRRLKPGSPLRIPLSMLREEAAQAEVLHAHGQAWYERPGAGRQPLQSGVRLQGGDLVLTGPQSSVSLRLADGTRSLVGSDSRLLLQRLARLGPAGVVDSRLRLEGGSLDTQVPKAVPPKRLQIDTPSVNLGVRGTEFRSRVDAGRSLAEVLQGQVAAGPQSVEAGFGLVATASGIGAPRALPPAPDLSGLPERFERLPLQLPIGSATSLRRYRAQVFETAAPGRLLLDGVFEQPLAQWPQPLADGQYELRVRALDADGLEGVDGRRAFTLAARPEPPLLLRPRAGEQLPQPSVTLSWSRNPEAASYRLQLATGADFAAPLVDRQGLDGSELKLELPVGRLHWRVAAVRQDGRSGPWGESRVLERVAPPPPPPPPATPSAQPPRAADEGLVLAWSAAPAPGSSFQVQVARDAGFSELVLDRRTEGSEVLFPRPAGGTYHVRVRSLAASGEVSAWGATQVIDVPHPTWWLWLLPLLLLL